MTEQHECWWVIRVESSGRIVAKCNDAGCPGELDLLDISHRLNKYARYETLKKATDALSAEDATELAGHHVPNYGLTSELNKSLQAYANILEDKNE